jgi:integrase
MKFTAKTIAALTLPEGKADHFEWDDDLPRFGHRLRRSGDRVARSWVVQYRHHGQSRKMTFDAVLSLEQARGEAKRILALVALGQDPATEKKRKASADRHTFKALAEQYLEVKESEVRPRTFIEWKRYLQESYFKPLHNLPVDSILRKDVAACVLAISRKNGQVAAARARSALSALFSWAMGQGLAENNPVVGTNKPAEPPERDRALSDPELLAVWKATEEETEFNRIVRLLIITGQRRSEVGGIAFSEIGDFDRAIWTIPAERAKNGREHKVPLGSLALEVIRSVPQVVGRDLLFGARADRGFTGWAEFKKLLDRRLGDAVGPWTLHDLRRTCATRLGDLGIEPHHVEALLNHRGHKRGVAGVYNKSKYAVAVKAAVAMWNNHLRDLIEGRDERGKVVTFPRMTV